MQFEPPIVSRGRQLEAAVDRLPEWYFHDIKDLAVPPLGPVCETSSLSEDKPQPLAEDDLKIPTEPVSNATMSCADDELELEKSTKTDQKTPDLGQSLSSRRSTTSSAATYTDLVLSGFSMRGREKKVMYHIDVVDHDAPLQTYTIRRSYSDFKDLHIQLSEIVDSRQHYYRSKAVSRLARGLASLSKDAMTTEDKVERAVMTFVLPALPHAGFLTFWKRHDRAHLQSRCDSFQELLRAVQRQPFLRESLPTLDREEEQRERKRRAQQHRRNSSSSTRSRVEY
ncbi:hypothetical protein JM16_000547 [Phytophthora kernoviae]|uniref:PX domain-containing protein n=1 Tax=Phytophthora kernoviae TaxID=325452 RepID=A0A8T0M8W5_9STRA|nr:hypothetical protein JM16_000547 [Phytophthora kernoviae]